METVISWLRFCIFISIYHARARLEKTGGHRDTKLVHLAREALAGSGQVWTIEGRPENEQGLQYVYQGIADLANCRKQKMKCEMPEDPPCKRCKATGAACLFKVRTNGSLAGDWVISSLTPGLPQPFEESVQRRLRRIESILGILDEQGFAAEPRSLPSLSPQLKTQLSNSEPSEDGLPDLLMPLAQLRTISGQAMHSGWEEERVEALWLAFAEHMPSLHFSIQRVFQYQPTPLLLAAILFAASMHHPLASFARDSGFYRLVTVNAISALINDSAEGSLHRPKDDTADLLNTLGIIIAGLLSAAWSESNGMWIAIAYQTILSRVAKSTKERQDEWKRLYMGLQVIDVEHASLLLTCPLVPEYPPMACLTTVAESGSDQSRAYLHITAIMHHGLSHLVNRQIPTVMETIFGMHRTDLDPQPMNPKDSQMIQNWARRLDEWLVMFHKPTSEAQVARLMPEGKQRGPSESNVMLLQYQLHKLFVLSLYHPVRGVDLSHKSALSAERKELLTAAREALQLQRMGMSIWSNWDLVIISLAAIIMIDAMGEAIPDRKSDRLLVQGHVNALRNTHQPEPNLRIALARRLEERLKQVQSPTSDMVPPVLPNLSPEYLSIFNPESTASYRVTEVTQSNFPLGPQGFPQPMDLGAMTNVYVPADGGEWWNNNPPVPGLQLDDQFDWTQRLHQIFGSQQFN